MMVILAKMKEPANRLFTSVVSQVIAMKKALEHLSLQDWQCLSSTPVVGSVFRITSQARHLQIFVEERDPREPSPRCSSPCHRYAAAVTVLVLCCTIIVLRIYKHRITVRSRGIIRSYAKRKLKRILLGIPRRAKIIFLVFVGEMIGEMKKSVTIGLAKAAANELMNLVSDGCRRMAK
ncbi:hypothetical protein E2C01_001300 [Portunus trituberculatus]|uniref:Uncharacterized protein n=1 Tax=Portunus trituberculatus TaxID=210409 RepID=A0A5B7CK26_PORTR|nr:hypothetical protein [Portunus trituberculatus]